MNDVKKNYWRRLLCLRMEKMKLMALLLFILAMPLQGQVATHGRLTITADQMPLKELLSEVSQKSGYKVFYNAALTKDIFVSMDRTEATLNEVLDEALKGTALDYTIENGTIVIHKREMTEDAKVRESRIVSGIIYDSEGYPLIGATIRVGASNRGTISNEDGLFKVTVPQDVHTLTVSYLGMKPQTIKIGAKNSISLYMKEDSRELDDVFVTGYQTISKERATGSYNIIKAEDIKQRNATNISSVLDGLVAGIQSADDDRGGRSFSIRGAGTMLGDNAPLIVVDGFPITDNSSSASRELNAFQKINPNDVESITVLKDAAAASIWGARSANGVIVITTKSGKNRDKLNVEVSTQMAVSNRYNINQVYNTARSADFIAYERMAFENGWTSGEFTGSFGELNYPVTQSQMLLYKGLRFGTMDSDEMERGLSALSQLDNREQIKKYLFEKPLLWQVNASISGGTEKSSTYASVMYQNKVGGMVNDKLDAYFVNFNNQYRFNKYVSLNIGANFQMIDEDNSMVTLSDIANLSPYEMLLNADGSYASMVGNYNTEVLSTLPLDQFAYNTMNYNLLQENRSRKNNTKHLLYKLQAGLDIDITSALKFSSKFQYEESRYDFENHNTEESFFVRNMVNFYTPYDQISSVAGESAIPRGGILMTSNGRTRSYVIRNAFAYDKLIGEKYLVSAIVGNEISQFKTTTKANPYLYGYNAQSLSSVPLSSSKAETIEGWEVSIPGTRTTMTWNNNRYVSFYGNASLIYDDRYGITASARSDASNMITAKPKYRWSPLWSVGLLWNVDRESFMENFTIFDRLSLRATYGENGNSCTLSSARTTIAMNSSQLDPSTGLNPGEIIDFGNPTLRWERTATTNVGLDFSLFSNSLFGTIEFYNKKGKDILGDVNISGANGTSKVVFNNAGILNRGMEFSLGLNKSLGSTDIELTGVLSYAYNHNKVTSLYQDHSTVLDVLYSSFVQGKPMYPVYAFEYLGMKDGVPYISDGEGGEISMDDYYLLVSENTKALKYMGTQVSPHTLGLNLGVSWKGVSVNAFINGRFGGKFRMPVFNYPTVEGWSKTKVNSFIGEVLAGSDRMPALPQPYDYGYSAWTSYFNMLDTNVESSSYIYFKELLFNYSLPQRLLHKIGFRDVSVFAKIENLGMIWSANSKHYHPEYLPGYADPALTYSFGLRINL